LCADVAVPRSLQETDSSDFPLASKLKQFKKFKSRFTEFWVKLVRARRPLAAVCLIADQAPSMFRPQVSESLPDLLFEKEMMDRITHWLVELSK
jgi:hypothetical protein